MPAAKTTFEVPLSNHPQPALISLEDADRVMEHRWWLGNRGYVQTSIVDPRGGLRADGVRAKRVVLLLHRLVMEVGPGDPKVDHRNRNPLDCTRSNLRIATDAENAQNKRAIGGSSEHRGVSWHKAAQKWEAHGKIGRRKQYLGLHDTEEDAAEAARLWRQEHMPFSEEAVHGGV